MLPTYWCQGHGGCECAWIPEIGPACDGQCDPGVISYCDGTCASARELLEQDIQARRVPAPAESTDTITLEVFGCDYTPASYTVAFEGPDAQQWALAYIAARRFTHVITESHLAPFSGETFPELAKVLYPVCHHGMSLDLCMDPVGENHYGTREWEMAQYGY